MQKTASKIADQVLVKVGFSVTDEGHEYDAETAEILRDAFLELSRRAQKRNAIGYRDPKTGKNPVDVMKALRYSLSNLADKGHPVVDARRMDYAAKQHRAGKNAWNPFGGSLTPLEQEEGATPGFFGALGKIKPKEPQAPSQE